MIRYHQYGSNYRLEQKRAVSSWIKTVVNDAGCSLADINIIFCGIAEIHEINKKHLKHDYPTDIVTFDYSENKTLSGDLYLGIPEIAENAKEYNVSLTEEIHRVIIHGILHLMGQKDKSKEEFKQMKQRENEALMLRSFHVKHKK
ncbi:MAG: rRNA maturation RNase YbeY [Luteibaculum sp.]